MTTPPELSTQELSEVVDRVLALIASKDFEVAEKLITVMCDGSDDIFGTVVTALGNATAAQIPAGAVLCGPSFYIWGNPFRYDHAWRCGLCPWVGTSYKTKDRAVGGALEHAAEHGESVTVYGPSGEVL